MTTILPLRRIARNAVRAPADRRADGRAGDPPIMSSTPLALDVPTAPPGVAGALSTVVAGERVELCAERALHWPRERTLFVADVHLGKAAAFRAGGVPLPRGATAADLARLTCLIERTRAARVVVLGDFLHARAGRVPALDAAFTAWREHHAGLDVTLVRGNHDRHAGDPPAHWRVDCVAAPYPLPPFLGCHDPVEPQSGHALCGHLHPGVWLSGPGEESARLPCFIVGTRRTVLPAFGRFTGLARVPLTANDQVVAIAGSRLFALPRQTAALSS